MISEEKSEPLGLMNIYTPGFQPEMRRRVEKCRGCRMMLGTVLISRMRSASRTNKTERDRERKEREKTCVRVTGTCPISLF